MTFPGEVAHLLGRNYYRPRSHFGDRIAPPILCIKGHLFVSTVCVYGGERALNHDFLSKYCLYARQHPTFSGNYHRRVRAWRKTIELFFAELARTKECLSVGYRCWHTTDAPMGGYGSAGTASLGFYLTIKKLRARAQGQLSECQCLGKQCKCSSAK